MQRRFFVSFIAWGLVWLEALTPVFAQLPTPAPSTQAQIDVKSSDIENLERQITQFEGEIGERRGRQRTLANDIAILDARIKKAQLEIRRLTLLMEKLALNIVQRKKDIAQAERVIGEKKAVIASQLALLDEQGRLPQLALYIASSRFSDFLSTLQALELLEQRVHGALLVVKEQKAALEDEKAQLEAQHRETEELKTLQTLQKEQLAQQQDEKRQLLKVTKGEEKKFQELVKLSKANIEKLKNEIYYLQRIGVTAQQAATLGALVAGRIGMRPAFLIAILEIESRLGANVGKGTWRVDMAPRDYDAFAQICRELGLNPDTTPVSKKPSYGWGGAMGPAQFLPTTWLGYRGQVTAFTGRATANPWNIEDAFFAAAIKLSKDGAASKTISGELAAAKAYIGGSPYCSKDICNYYANLAIDKAADIEKTLQ